MNVKTAERAAQALCDTYWAGALNNLSDGHRRVYLIAAVNALAALRPGDRVGPDGSLMVVPVKPTEAMIARAFERVSSLDMGSYSALLAAAKEPSA